MIPKELLRKVRQIQIRTRHMVSDLFAGSYHSVFKGQGMEFQEVREYVPGDDIRAIDWNVTARMGHPYIKKYVEERELTVLLAVDVSRSMDFGSGAQFKKDLAAEIAAVVAFAATQNNDRIGLALFAEQVEHFLPPRKGPRHVLRVIRDALYFHATGRGTRLGNALAYINRVLTRRSVVLVISDFLDDDFRAALTVAARRHDVIAVVLDDRREKEWVAAGLIEWEDAETGQRHLVDTSDRHTREALQRREDQRRLARDQQLRAAGVDIIRLTTGQPYAPELVKFFRQRERRRAA